MGIKEKYYRTLQQNGHEKAIARLLLVKEVLCGKATHIYEGWCRPNKDDCYVYVGSPARDYKSLTIDTPSPTNMVFLVFVLPDGEIAEWTWRPVSAEDGSPKGITGDLIWKTSES
jgi:hypothetical protein